MVIIWCYNRDRMDMNGIYDNILLGGAKVCWFSWFKTGITRTYGCLR